MAFFCCVSFRRKIDAALAVLQELRDEVYGYLEEQKGCPAPEASSKLESSVNEIRAKIRKVKNIIDASKA